MKKGVSQATNTFSLFSYLLIVLLLRLEVCLCVCASGALDGSLLCEEYVTAVAALPPNLIVADKY